MNTTSTTPSVRARFRSALRISAAIALYLLGGLTISLLIAALTLMYAPAHMIEDRGGIGADDTSPGAVGYKHGQLYAGFGYREWMDYYWTSFKSTSGSSVTGAGVSAVRCGWPFLALTTPPEDFPIRCDTQAEWTTAINTAYSHPGTSRVLPKLFHVRDRQIPTRPIPAGLIANSAIFAAFLFGLHRALPAARRAFRRRAGKCAACGYPVRGLQTCPECGLGLARRLVASLRRILPVPLCHSATLPLLPPHRLTAARSHRLTGATP